MLKTLTLTLAAVAGFLWLSSSDAEACCVNVDLWANVGVRGAVATERLCLPAAGQLSNQGFDFLTAVEIQPRLTALMFRRENDFATLFCAANVIEEILDEF